RTQPPRPPSSLSSCAALRPSTPRAVAARREVGDHLGMRYGIVVTSGDPRLAARLAAEAEGAGWDGVSTFDAIAIGADPMYDPWVVLAAMAMRTARVRLGAIVFAPARRRPWKLAREAISLDVLSGGRLVLPVGLGTLDDAGFG